MSVLCLQWDDAMDNCQLKDPPVLNESLDEPRHISIRSLMKFDGPAPEIINGRAAMIGWSLAAINEVFGDKGVIAQLCSQPQEVVVIFTLVLVASLFPLGQNVMPHHKEHGIFKAKAELWGGRIACALPAACHSLLCTGTCVHHTVNCF